MELTFKAGTLPILVSIPHAGTDIPGDIAARMAPCALALADTDWHLPELYSFLGALGASTLAARWSRYVIDVNRPLDDSNLYPGLDTTGLCPLDTFKRERLYLDGQAPTAAEVRQRIQRYWQPYHNQLRAELDRLLALHGTVLLWDAHSIASRVPRFFDGRLPDLNFGTADGSACAPGLSAAVMAPAHAAQRYSIALDARFKGGFITRHYGQPQAGVHAIQLEMCQCLYMNENANENANGDAPFAYRPDLAREIEPLLRQMIDAALDWVRK